jgi:hypothetical protein
MDLREVGWDGRIGSMWLRIGTGGGLMWTRWWTSGFHKMLGSSRVAAQLATSQKGLSSMSEWATQLSQDGAVGIATAYGLDDCGVGVRVPLYSRHFSSSRRPERMWVPPNLLANGYRGPFPRG